MAVIHRTTLTPTKLELLAPWLPERPWYRGAGRSPEPSELARGGGFRLDDPEGEVGIEFLVVTDASGGRTASYHVPLTYRGAPLEEAGAGLIGTAEHGVLGRRWVYDGVHDPVLADRLLALLRGRAEPQAQSLSDTPDPSVLVRAAAVPGGAAGPATVTDGPESTALVLPTAAEAGPGPRVAVEVARVLDPGPDPAGTLGHVTGNWRLPDGGERSGVLALLRDAPR
ncbi:1,4-alpha-glucan branching protein [Streptomyces sp. DSM 44917]|uniref:1,4-alpha-glucan branching protein n=1 Tax=Streptomyces boetiae TaxID=3075541 RepID=A0ABU2LD69_9ACTN|nr:1,4-alpha-glucan branching protein [Streptomyces sp. DSM 44917]MDT0309529.1 1,4-alpha-glucan branching protein [Streptomyces sp. DSM 44917]